MTPEEKKYYRQIAQSVETQQYYEDAKEWYQIKYLYPVIERSFFLFLTLVSVICSIIAFAVLSSFLPLTTHVPIAVSNNDPVQQYTTISKMTEKLGYSNADDVVQRYLLKRYIESFEEYDYFNDFEKLSANLRFIKTFSTPAMHSYYEFFISLRNTDSMRLKYREHTKRFVEIKEDSFKITEKKRVIKKFTDEAGNIIEYPEIHYAATATFTSIVSNQNGEKRTIWKARADYVYSAITFIRSKMEFLPLYFRVEDYQSLEID